MGKRGRDDEYDRARRGDESPLRNFERNFERDRSNSRNDRHDRDRKRVNDDRNRDDGRQRSNSNNFSRSSSFNSDRRSGNNNYYRFLGTLLSHSCIAHCSIETNIVRSRILFKKPSWSLNDYFE